MSLPIPAAAQPSRPQPARLRSVPDPAPDAGADRLRRLFRRHAAGVAAITTAHAGVPAGLLATSLASVSAEPPILSFNVARTASSWPALSAAEHLAVHLLAEDQGPLAERFARSGADRFAAPTSWQPGPHGVPVLDDVAAWSLARVEGRIPVGDHVIVLARVLRTSARAGAAPLVHHDGAFHRPVPAADA